MKIPETYEEFLKTPKDELKRIAEMDDFTVEIGSRIMSFIVKANNELKQKMVNESRERKLNHNTIWEDLYDQI